MKLARVPALIFATGVCCMNACPGLAAAPTEKQVVPISEWTGTPTWSPDGKLVAVRWPAPAIINEDGTVSNKNARVGNSRNIFGNGVHIPTSVTSLGHRVVFSPANSNMDRSLILRFPSLACCRVFKRTFFHEAFSPDGQYFVADGLNGVLQIESGKLLVKFPEATSESFSWSPDGRLLAVSRKGGIDIWNLASKRLTFSKEVICKGHGCEMGWSPDGSKLAFSFRRSNMESVKTQLMIHSTDGSALLRLFSSSGFGNFGWSKDSGEFAYCDERLHILDGRTLMPIFESGPEQVSVTNLKWSPDGRTLAYSDKNGLLKLLDRASRKVKCSVQAEKNGRFDFFWSPDGKFLAISAHEKIALCDTSTGEFKGALDAPEVEMKGWSPDGNGLVLVHLNADSVSIKPLDLKSATVLLSGGAEGNPWKDQKVLNNMDDCLDELERTLPASMINAIRSLKLDRLYQVQGEPGLGMTIRNSWGLRESNHLTEYFNGLGVKDGQSMSLLIIENLWYRLNDRPYDLKKRAQELSGSDVFRNYIIHDCRSLPEELAARLRQVRDDHGRAISETPGKVKLVFLVREDSYLLPECENGLKILASEFPSESVSFILVKVPSEKYSGKSALSNYQKEKMAEAALLEKKLRAEISICRGDAELVAAVEQVFPDLRSVNGNWTAQGLVLTNNTSLKLRINGFPAPELTYAVEDELNRLIKENEAAVH